MRTSNFDQYCCYKKLEVPVILLNNFFDFKGCAYSEGALIRTCLSNNGGNFSDFAHRLLPTALLNIMWNRASKISYGE